MKEQQGELYKKLPEYEGNKEGIKNLLKSKKEQHQKKLRKLKRKKKDNSHFKLVLPPILILIVIVISIAIVILIVSFIKFINPIKSMNGRVGEQKQINAKHVDI